MTDGGQAFPIGSGQTPEKGMTLREYYAGQFAAAWVSALALRHKEHGYTDVAAAHEANALGLRQADAMLKAREATK